MVFEPFVDQLMRSRNQTEIVDMAELGRDLVAKQPAGSSRTDGPCLDVFGVAPNKVAEGAFVGYFLCPCHDADLV